MVDDSARTASPEAPEPPVPRSDDDQPVWPALPSSLGQLYFALLYSLDRSQWWPPEVHERLQFEQLAHLLAHSLRTVPFYRERLSGLGLRPGASLDRDAWRTIPVLTRADIQGAGQALHSEAVPPEHGPPHVIATSGSTGAPVKVVKSELSLAYWRAFVLREWRWAGFDPAWKKCILRRDKSGLPVTPAGNLFPSWSEPMSVAYRTGSCLILDPRFDLSGHAQRIAQYAPEVISAWPTLLRALAEQCKRDGVRLPSLRLAHTWGEVVDDDLRQLCREVWGIPIHTAYNAEEPGYIATQCPEHEHYHVQSEAALVEILDDAGRPCAEGETGRVVVTPLQNFTMPLLRYEIGDYATVGAPCPCGRGLPVLAQIAGRRRNMLRLPGGRRGWPSLNFDALSKYGIVARFQTVQLSLEDIEIRVAAGTPLPPEAERDLLDKARARLGHHFRVALRYVDSLPGLGEAKFEDFRCEMPD